MFPFTICTHMATRYGVLKSYIDLRLVMFVAAGIAMLAARWIHINTSGSDLQLGLWEEQYAIFLGNWEKGHDAWSHVFALTENPLSGLARLWNLLLYIFNGGLWDVQYFAHTNQLLLVAVLLILVSMTADWKKPTVIWLLLMLAILAAVIPSGWQTLFTLRAGGYYWSLLFQLIAIYLWLTQPRGTLAWWLGLPVLILALLSAETAFISALVTGLILTAHAYGRNQRRDMALALIIFALGIAGMVWQIKYQHAGWELRESWLVAAAHCVDLLGYPFSQQMWPFLLLWLPWAVILIQWLRSRSSQNPLDLRLIVLGSWLLVHVILISGFKHAYGSFEDLLAQHGDLLALGSLINTACLLRLILGENAVLSVTQYKWLVVTGWMALQVMGYWQAAGEPGGWVKGNARFQQEKANASQQLHEYLTTGDRQRLSDHWVNRDNVVTMFQDPAVRAVMPAKLQPPMVPYRVIPEGKAYLPHVRPEDPLFHHKNFGLMERPGFSGAGRLQLLYELPQGRHHFIFRGDLQPATSADVVLQWQSSDGNQVLIGHDQPLPWPQVHRAASIQSDLPFTFYLATSDGKFTLDMIDRGTQAGGQINISSPILAGPAEFWLKRIAVHAKLFFSITLAIMLSIGGYLFLNANAICWKTSRQKIVILLVVLTASLLILLVRKPGYLLNPQFMVEDGTVFFQDHYNFGSDAILLPHAGYLHLLPRLVAWVSGHLFAYETQPLVFMLTATAFMLLVISSFFSERLPFTQTQKIMMAFVIMLAPMPDGELWSGITYIQWFGAVLLFILPLKSAPHGLPRTVRRQWTADILTVTLLGLTGPFLLIVLPVYFINMLWKRNRHALVLFLLATGVTGIQMTYVLSKASFPDNYTPMDVTTVAVVLEVVSQRLFKDFMLFGLTDYHLPSLLLSVLYLTLWGFLLHTALRQRRDDTSFSQAISLIAIINVLMLGAIYWRLKGGMIFLIDPYSGPRYVILSFWLATLAIIMLLRSPQPWRRTASILLLSMILATSLVHGFYTKPWPEMHWESYARQINPNQSMQIPSLPEGWQIKLNAKTPPEDR